MNISDFKINRLTAVEIQELQLEQALRIIESNTNTLADIETLLFDEIAEAGKHRIAVDQLKSLKSSIIEQNRALKSVVQNG
jgi:hypothetical protein